MYSSLFAILCFGAVVVTPSGAHNEGSYVDSSPQLTTTTTQQQQQPHVYPARYLQQNDTTATTTTHTRVFDIYLEATDECYDAATETVGPCDVGRFPVCQDATELICFNRRPRQDKFYPDLRLPAYMIDYDSVFCYPQTWTGCGSCNPGRLCLSEQRCILDDRDYPCARWW